MPTLPQLDVVNNSNNSPHVLVLGAGASIAAFPNGDRNGLKLPLMENLVEIVELEPRFAEYGLKYEGDNFEAFYSDLVSEAKHPQLVLEIQRAIEDYFSRMELPDEATLYDYLVLSLRDKDIIATFNWDPFLAKAFQRNSEIVGYEQMPQLAFLHGNVAIGLCHECKTKGWRFNFCDKCSSRFAKAKLLYPVNQKNYSDDEFLLGEWGNLQQHIHHAYFLTFFGYSAPVTDAEAKKLMYDVWSENTTKDLAQIDFIDIKKRDEIVKNWKNFIVRENYSVYSDFFETCLSIHPRRSCDAFAMATLQQRPWKENRFPQNVSLRELQNWVSPLVEEEKLGKLSGKPCG